MLAGHPHWKLHVDKAHFTVRRDLILLHAIRSKTAIPPCCMFEAQRARLQPCALLE